MMREAKNDKKLDLILAKVFAFSSIFLFRGLEADNYALTLDST